MMQGRRSSGLNLVTISMAAAADGAHATCATIRTSIVVGPSLRATWRFATPMVTRGFGTVTRSSRCSNTPTMAQARRYRAADRGGNGWWCSRRGWPTDTAPTSSGSGSAGIPGARGRAPLVRLQGRVPRTIASRAATHGGHQADVLSRLSLA